ncbi:MAG: hypothetical protein Q8L88_03770, partial [Bacteroidota bacterium]|nr:hypothetical protein [Bacteroidota bacterium]
MKNIIITIVLALLFSDLMNAQVFFERQTLKRGKLWATVWNTLQYGEPTDLENRFHTLDYPGYSKSTNVNDPLNYAEAVGYAIYGVRQNIASSYTINSRFLPSHVDISPIEETVLTKNYNLANIGIAGEEIVTGAHHVNNLNVDIARRSMVWSYPGLSDFSIHEVTITNNELTSVDSLFFGMRYGLRMTQRSGSKGDEKYGWDPTEKLFYFYDHQRFNIQTEVPIVYNFGVGPLRGDIGDARDIYQEGVQEHELDAPGYFTVIVLDSAGANIFQNILEYTGQGVTEGANIVDQMFIQGVSSHSRVKEVMTHQQPRMSWDSARALGGEGGNKYERCPEYLVSVGPLSLTPFTSVKIVYAEVMGEMDRAKIVDGGIANIDLMETASRDSMLSHVRGARKLYANNYLPTVHPPPTPTNGENSLTIIPELEQIIIDWPPIPSTYKDAIIGINDVAGYRVYRSTYFTIGPWLLAADIKKDSIVLVNGNIRYVDKNLSSSVGNYYCVTSYDLNGNESGKVNNTRLPVYSLAVTNLQSPNNAYVLPNTFGIQQNYPNPFNPVTTIQFSIPVENTVELKAYDILGKEIVTLVQER